MADTQIDFENMSDEEFMRLGPPTVTEVPAKEETHEEEEEEREEEESETEEEESEEEEETSEDESEEESEEEHEEETDEERAAREQAEAEAAARKPVKKEPKEPRERGEDGKFSKDPAKEQAEEAERLFKPFKANGREMSIRSADEGIRLMQMGANYSKKMEELKPQLALVRSLEREGLADIEKLSYLIDLHKKNPQAIAKLVKDANFDPLSVEDDQVSNYKPGNYQTSEKEMVFEEVLDGLRTLPRYNELIDTVANKWDAASKNAVGDNPEVLRTLGQQMDNGVYDRVMDEVNRQKALGNLRGVPMLQAYRDVGQQLEKDGQLADLIAPQKQGQRKLVTPGKDKARATREADEQRRKAAAPTRKTGNPAPKKKVVDVWNMSDDDFAKLKL